LTRQRLRKARLAADRIVAREGGGGRDGFLKKSKKMMNRRSRSNGEERVMRKTSCGSAGGRFRRHRTQKKHRLSLRGPQRGKNNAREIISHPTERMKKSGRTESIKESLRQSSENDWKSSIHRKKKKKNCRRTRSLTTDGKETAGRKKVWGPEETGAEKTIGQNCAQLQCSSSISRGRKSSARKKHLRWEGMFCGGEERAPDHEKIKAVNVGSGTEEYGIKED